MHNPPLILAANAEDGAVTGSGTIQLTRAEGPTPTAREDATIHLAGIYVWASYRDERGGATSWCSSEDRSGIPTESCGPIQPERSRSLTRKLRHCLTLTWAICGNCPVTLAV
jgi:hypothetical protein